MTSVDAIFDQPSVWRAEEILRSGLDGQDRMIAASPGPGFPLTLERVVTLTRVTGGQRIVDIGSGLGGATMWLAEASGADITGVEPVPACLHASRRLFPALRVRGESLEELRPDGSEQADVVTALGLVSLAAATASVIAGLVGMVRPLGHVAVVDLFATRSAFRCGRNMFATVPLLGRLLREVGADLVCFEPTPPTPANWKELDEALNAAVASRHDGETAFEDWKRDRQTLRYLHDADLIRPGVVVAVKRGPTNAAPVS